VATKVFLTLAQASLTSLLLLSNNQQNVVNAIVLPPQLPEPCSTARRLRRQAGADLAVVTTDADLHMASGLALMGKFDGVFGLMVLPAKNLRPPAPGKKCAGGYDEGTCLCADSCRVVTW
jgi:hypothetical protein